MAFSFVVAPSERFSMAEVVGGDGQPCNSLWMRKFEATGLQAAKSDCPEAARKSPLVEAVTGDESVDSSGKTRHCTPSFAAPSSALFRPPAGNWSTVCVSGIPSKVVHSLRSVLKKML